LGVGAPESERTVTELLTVDDLAELLRTTPAGVRRMRQRGTLPPAVKVGTRVLWRRDELERWIDDRHEDGRR
jgi:excisionase family DNA binding protein